MDTINKFQQAILDVLEPFANQKVANPGLEKQLIADTKRHRYQVIVQGWEKGEKFVNSTLLHLEIKDDKIWIQQNWTELQIAQELVKRGVPAEQIVLGFLPEYMREDSEYAVAWDLIRLIGQPSQSQIDELDIAILELWMHL